MNATKINGSGLKYLKTMQLAKLFVYDINEENLRFCWKIQVIKLASCANHSSRYLKNTHNFEIIHNNDFSNSEMRYLKNAHMAVFPSGIRIIKNCMYYFKDHHSIYAYGTASLCRAINAYCVDLGFCGKRLYDDFKCIRNANVVLLSPINNFDMQSECIEFLNNIPHICLLFNCYWKNSICYNYSTNVIDVTINDSQLIIDLKHFINLRILRLCQLETLSVSDIGDNLNLKTIILKCCIIPIDILDTIAYRKNMVFWKCNTYTNDMISKFTNVKRIELYGCVGITKDIVNTMHNKFVDTYYTRDSELIYDKWHCNR